MKRGMTMLSAAALVFALAGSAMAQGAISPGAVANADYKFFDSHPKVAHQLAKDPTLIDNEQFVDSHPELHAYLKSHPYIRHEFRDHPYKFMHREDVYDAHHN